MKNLKTLVSVLILGAGLTITGYSVPAFFNGAPHAHPTPPPRPIAPTAPHPVAQNQAKDQIKQNQAKDQIKQNQAQEAAKDQIKENKQENVEDGIAELRP